MPTCQRVKFTNKKVCAGDLRHIISIIDRAIISQNKGYAMDFSDGVQTRAAIKVKTDIVNFDGTNTKTQITHDFYIRKGNAVQSSNTILFDSRYFSVIGSEILDEMGQFVRITTSEAGTTANQSNY